MKFSIRGIFIILMLSIQIITGVALTAVYQPEIFFSAYTMTIFSVLVLVNICGGYYLATFLKRPLEEACSHMKNCDKEPQAANDAGNLIIEMDLLSKISNDLCRKHQSLHFEKAQLYDEMQHRHTKIEGEKSALEDHLASLSKELKNAQQDFKECQKEKDNLQDRLHSVLESVNTECDSSFEKIEQYKEQLESVLASIHSFPDAFLVLDGGHKVLFANKAAADLLETNVQALQDSSFPYPTPVNQKTEIAINTRQGRTIATEVLVVETRWQDQKAYVVSMRDITERKEATLSLSESNKTLQAIIRKLESRDEQLQAITTMAKLFQLCSTEKEVHAVIADNIENLFPVQGGSVYTLDEDINVFSNIHHWGKSNYAASFLTPDQCWALKTGQPHLNIPSKSHLICNHINDGSTPAYDCICVPMANNEEQMGLIFLEYGENGNSQNIDDQHLRNVAFESVKELCSTTADHIALALTNIRLQEKLQESAIKDALTGLYNRRHTLDFLRRELYMASKSNNQVSIILLDVDHFKQFNDNFGHDAGDYVLKMTGAMLQHSVRKGEIACRYGGEEFLIILPGTTLEQASEAGEKIRAKFESQTFQHEKIPLGTVTISIGVATFPLHGDNLEVVIKAADKALYEAKNTGRNRVSCASRSD